MPVKIKICGITRLEDAKVAVSLGVDALGFIFHPKSPRCIDPSSAREIIRQLPPFIGKVGVFVDADLETVADTARRTGIDALQFHGAETPGYCGRFTMSVIKAFSVGADFDAAILDTYDVSGFLLDTWDDKSRGGTGRTFDWSIARRICDVKKNVVLAGGLGPTNIEEALAAVGPYAVDLNSGVEVKPGVKNPNKMREAVQIVRNWK